MLSYHYERISFSSVTFGELGRNRKGENYRQVIDRMAKEGFSYKGFMPIKYDNGKPIEVDLIFEINAPIVCKDKEFPIFIGIKEIIIQIMIETGISELSLNYLRDVLKKLYVGLHSQDLLEKYNISFEVDSHYLDNIATVYDDLFYLDDFHSSENPKICFRYKEDFERYRLCNQIDSTILDIIKNIVSKM